jgi:aminomethyltransferase
VVGSLGGVSAGRSPLYATHAALGGRFVEFAGWDMPVQYEGVIAEHNAVRSGVGVFDVSHLGRFRLEGAGSTELLLRLLCNNITHIEPGRAQYTMALTAEGGVIDDIIVWRFDTERYWVVPNGANQDDVLELFVSEAPPAVTIESKRHDTALLAVQGPNAPDLIAEVAGESPKRFRVLESMFDGAPLRMAGTGYTGERGAELVIAAEYAEALWTALTEAGAVPCGLGSRDTLRLEMGYPLWGQDLDRQTTPLEAGLGWVVEFDHDFVGKGVLEDQMTDGLRKKLVPFRMQGRHIARHGYRVRAGDATGEVASGNFSPTLDGGIGMAYLSPDPGDVAEVDVEVRGEWRPATVSAIPFI